jgi:hypothetical protein
MTCVIIFLLLIYFFQLFISFLNFYKLNGFCQIDCDTILSFHSILSIGKYKRLWGNLCSVYISCAVVYHRFSRWSVTLFSRRIQHTETTYSCLWLLQSSEHEERDETTASCYYRNRLSEECVGSNVTGNKELHICVLRVNWREENTAWTSTTYAIKLQHNSIVLFRIPNFVRRVSVIIKRYLSDIYLIIAFF